MAQSVLELTLLYGHPLYMDTPFLLTVCFVPGIESPDIFYKFNSLNTDIPVNTDTLSVRINGV